MDSRALIKGQVRECYGRVVYSHKTHEKELLSNFVYEARSGGLFLNAVDEMNSSNDVCDQLRSV